MKKSNFIALILGTVSGVLFALGMCMALLPEWDSFTEGIVFGVAGLVCGMITWLVWCKMEKKPLPKISGKTLFRTFYILLSLCVLGTGMCLCLVWVQFVWGILTGLVGILMLLGLIPMFKGLK